MATLFIIGSEEPGEVNFSMLNPLVRIKGYPKPIKSNTRNITAATGCRNGANSISGDGIVVAQGGELLLHLSNHFICGLLLLPSAQ